MRKRFALLLGVVVTVGVAVGVLRVLPAIAVGEAASQEIIAPPALVVQERIYTPDTPANRKLHDATMRGDLSAARAALKAGADPETIVQINGPNHPGIPIYYFAWSNISDESPQRLTLFQLLAEHVKNVNNVSEPGAMTLLMMAVDAGDLALVKSIVERGATVDAVTKTTHTSGAFPNGNETAFYQAVTRGGDRGDDPDPIAVYLLSKGANVNQVSADGCTPLIRAAQQKKLNTIRLLLDQGADPALRDKRGYSALRWASMRGSDEIIALLAKRTPMNLWEAASFGNAARVKELLAAGADPNETHPMPNLPPQQIIDGKTPVGETPLAAAAKSNDPATIKILLDAGANARYTHPYSGQSALHIAASYGSDAAIPLLLAAGADVNAPAVRRDAKGKPEEDAPVWQKTPLLCAVEDANATTVSLLLKSGVRPAQYDQVNNALKQLLRSLGRVPLRRRDQKSSQTKPKDEALDAQGTILDMLLTAGADLNKTGAVVYAVRANQPDVIRDFLQKGASPNAYSTETGTDADETALMAAIKEIGLHTTERVMVRNGSSSGSEESDIDDAEKTARECLAILLKAGTDVNEGSRQSGETPLMVAIENNLLPVAADLLKRGAKIDATDSEEHTALMRLASEGENVDGVGWLLRNGAKPNLADSNGYTALMLTIDNGANDNWEEFQKRTVEHRKQEAEHMRQVHGVEPQEDQRPNPNGHPKMVALLMKSGADKTIVAKDGKTTALTLARKNGFKALEALLSGKK